MTASSLRIAELFDNITVDNRNLDRFLSKKMPVNMYLIAMTPRSGSSYLCDILHGSKLFGRPGEYINPGFILKNLQMVPGRTPEEYLINMLKHTSSWNGVAGLKASWFQFELFIRALNSRNVLRAFQYIYLYRRDIYAQAVSLYKATESQVVHGNMEHSKDALDKLASLRYNYEHIYKWHQHIIKQEEGWAEFFMTNNVVPLCISYEEISKDIYNIVRRIALYLNIPEQLIEKYSLHSGHTKLANRQSTEWAYRYALEFDHVTRSRTSPRSFFAQQLVKMKRIFTLHNTFKKMIN